MSGDLTQPFDYNPTAVKFGNSATPYTCPAGKYARITATLNTSHVGNASSTGGNATATAAANSSVVTFWVFATHVVSATASAGSIAPTASPATVAGTSVATLFIDTGSGANKIALVNSSASASEASVGGSISTSGSAEVNFVIDEYDSVS